MTPQLAVHVVGQAIMAAFWICAPLLLISFALGIVINLVQIATSMQDPVFSSVPRLASCLVCLLVLMPWMLRHAISFATGILGNLAQYAR